ncbi:hypothetical protein HMI54_013335 [Coelomomyces lativittatus]|nr:hypothetical protein HMI55_000243 [Coelomomyces lativittatus]KAJ1513420.1 hypothetical protein HMI56_002489 [Coelomomyces lativittatus]KAJ1514852.1 hypothetical protein HMI54_013335 [Coelomomyces lativittatus]
MHLNHLIVFVFTSFFLSGGVHDVLSVPPPRLPPFSTTSSSSSNTKKDTHVSEKLDPLIVSPASSPSLSHPTTFLTKKLEEMISEDMPSYDSSEEDEEEEEEDDDDDDDDDDEEGVEQEKKEEPEDSDGDEPFSILKATHHSMSTVPAKDTMKTEFYDLLEKEDPVD